MCESDCKRQRDDAFIERERDMMGRIRSAGQVGEWRRQRQRKGVKVFF